MAGNNSTLIWNKALFGNLSEILKLLQLIFHLTGENHLIDLFERTDSLPGQENM